MSEKLRQKPESFDEAVKAAYNSPDRVLEIDTEFGHVVVSITVPLDKTKKIWEIPLSSPNRKKPISLDGSIEILGDLNEGSKEIANQFQKSLKNTAQKL